MHVSLVHTAVMFMTRLDLALEPQCRKWSKMEVSNWMEWRVQRKACLGIPAQLGGSQGISGLASIFPTVTGPPALVPSRLPSLQTKHSHGPKLGLSLLSSFSPLATPSFIQPWAKPDLQKKWFLLKPIFQTKGRKPRKSLVISNKSCFCCAWEIYQNREGTEKCR